MKGFLYLRFSLTTRCVLVAVSGGMIISGCAKPVAPPPTHLVSGPFAMDITTVPAPPHTGDNTLVVDLHDAKTGTQIGNANITVAANMVSPVTPGQAVSGRSQGGGRYDVPMRLAIGTDYDADIHIDAPAEPSTDAHFKFNVAQ